MAFEFELGKPFKPFEQLMGVLPFASREHIPQAFQVRRKNLFLHDSILMLTFNPIRTSCTILIHQSWTSTRRSSNKI